MIRVQNGSAAPHVPEAVFFPFDDRSIPLRAYLYPQLIAGKRGGYTAPIVLPNGPIGSHDETAFYYGTTIKIGDEFRMWYHGRKGLPVAPYFEQQFPQQPGGAPSLGHPGLPPIANLGLAERGGRVCYAVSKDGVHWEKPALGLVEFDGSRENNIVDVPDLQDITAVSVLYEPEEPDPEKRFKMLFEDWRFGQRLSVAYSADGLRWRQSPNNPVGPVFEFSGVAKFGDCYYAAGQGGIPCSDDPGRNFVTLLSYDFENWWHGGVYSMRRTPPHQGSPWAREEVHLGAGLHNRGNVILGVYGMWHMPHSWDRRQVVCDLGLAISNDALHFREPIANFKLLGAHEEPEAMIGLGPALSQGQGMESVGDKTYYWYSLWPTGGQVRLAQWERDRFGYFEPARTAPCFCITCPFQPDGPGARAFLNVGAVGEHAELYVEVLDERFQPIPGYAGDDGAVVKTPGFRVPVEWPGGAALSNAAGALRLKLSWRGLRWEDPRLYTIYVAE